MKGTRVEVKVGRPAPFFGGRHLVGLARKLLGPGGRPWAGIGREIKEGRISGAQFFQAP
jgi:hypothetical protein